MTVSEPFQKTVVETCAIHKLFLQPLCAHATDKHNRRRSSNKFDGPFLPSVQRVAPRLPSLDPPFPAEASKLWELQRRLNRIPEFQILFLHPDR